MHTSNYFRTRSRALKCRRDLIVSQNTEESATQVTLTADKLNDLDRQIAQLKKTLKSRTESFLGSVIPEGRETNGAQGSAGLLGQYKQRIIEQQIELDGLIAKKEALTNVIVDYEQQFNQIPRKSIRTCKAATHTIEQREALSSRRGEIQ